MDDEEMRCGMSCRFLRSELADLQTGSRLARTLIRADGLKYRNVTCGFLFIRDAQQPELASLLAIRSFDISCDYCLVMRVRLQVLLQDVPLREIPWQEETEFREDNHAIRFSGLLRLADFEGSPSNSVVTIKVFLDVCRASPAFLLPPRVPTFDLAPLCDDEQEMATLLCSDASLRVRRTTLRFESPAWSRALSDEVTSKQLDCKDFSAAQMRAFLFFLQSRDFYDIARFDTFHLLVKIAAKFSVDSVLRRCGLFINECLLLEQSSRSAEPSDSSGRPSVAVCSKVRWGIGDLVALWDATISHLKDEFLAIALMNLISKFPYTEVASQTAFKQLNSTTKSTFYHQYLLDQEAASEAESAPPAYSENNLN